MLNKSYSLRQAAKLSGVPTMTFHAWKEKGLVTPDVADDKGNISLFSEMMIDRAKEIDKQRKAKKSANNSGNLFENTAFVESVEKGEDLPNDEATSAGLPRQSKAIIEQPDPDRDVDSGNSPTKTFAEDASEGTAAPMSDSEVNHREKEKAIKTSETPITIDLASASDVVTLEERADRIRQLQADVQRGIIDIGFELIAAKKEIGHGQWQNWLATEFDWTDRTARNFMAIAERYGNRKTFSDLNPATLIKMLALPEGDEQNFIDAQTAAGRPIETQSAREVQRNVKAWKEQHAPADDDSSENLSSFEETEKHGKIAAVVAPCVEEESTSEDTPPARKYAELIIDEEFSNILPPLKDYELKELEESILRYGILDPLVVWNCILLDGHARYEIAKRHNLPFKIVEVKNVADRDEAFNWIIYNQLGRRSLTEYERVKLVIELEKILNSDDSDDGSKPL